MEWMLMPLRRYANFSGRSRRKEYWAFALFVIAVYLAILLASSLLASGGEAGALEGGIGLILLSIFGIGILIPSLAVQVRRFHDQDKSGWFVLLNLIPLFGGIAVLIFMCLEGTRGPNRFGADPKEGDRSPAVAA